MPRAYFASASLLLVLFGLPSLGVRTYAHDSPASATSDGLEIITDDACSSSFDQLLILLKSEDTSSRVAAANCLGKLGDKRAVEPLLHARFVEKYPRYVQVYENALRVINDPYTADLLLAALKSADTRWAAAFTLGRLQLSRGVDPLLALLKSGDIENRKTAAEALGFMKDARATDPLCGALKDEDEVLRRFAAAALGEIGDTRATDSLNAALRDSDDGVRWNAANSLGDLRDGRAVEPLSQALGDDAEIVQKAAADALGKIGDPLAAEPLIAAVRSGNRVIQWHSAAALANIRDPQAAQFLTTSLREGKLNVVAAAYPFFIRKGDPTSLPVIVEALNEHGDSEMAQSLMVCGNLQLQDAAREWAKRNKMEDLNLPEKPSVVWGSEE